jgi:Holliday junction resolvasome RuvABC DNA-binding subunit
MTEPEATILILKLIRQGYSDQEIKAAIEKVRKDKENQHITQLQEET